MPKTITAGAVLEKRGRNRSISNDVMRYIIGLEVGEACFVSVDEWRGSIHARDEEKGASKQAVANGPQVKSKAVRKFGTFTRNAVRMDGVDGWQVIREA